MTKMVNHGSGRVRLEFRIPARGLIGFRSQFLTDTKGTGIMHHLFSGMGAVARRDPLAPDGALVADRTGAATAYAIANLQERGEIFIEPATQVYEGMVIGENARAERPRRERDEEKKQTNMRASTADEAVRLIPPRQPRPRAGDRVHQRRRAGRGDAASIRLRKKVLAANMRPKRHGGFAAIVISHGSSASRSSISMHLLRAPRAPCRRPSAARSGASKTGRQREHDERP